MKSERLKIFAIYAVVLSPIWGVGIALGIAEHKSESKPLQTARVMCPGIETIEVRVRQNFWNPRHWTDAQGKTVYVPERCLWMFTP